MKNKKSDYGFRGVFRNNSFIKLSPFAFLPTIIVVYVSTQATLGVLGNLSAVIDLALSILPLVLSILIASYAIIHSLYWSPSVDYLKKKEEGIRFLNILNTSFAGTIINITLILIVTLLVKLIFVASITVKEEISNIVNLTTLFVIAYFLFNSLWLVVGVVLNLFNLSKMVINIEK